MAASGLGLLRCTEDSQACGGNKNMLRAALEGRATRPHHSILGPK